MCDKMCDCNRRCPKCGGLKVTPYQVPYPAWPYSQSPVWINYTPSTGGGYR